MGGIISLIPTEGIWVCILVPFVLLLLFAIVAKIFNIETPRAKKKIDFYTMVGETAKNFSSFQD